MSEVNRMRAVVAELIAENLTLKKGVRVKSFNYLTELGLVASLKI